MTQIHKTSEVHPSAELADDVVVGSGSIIGADVKIGEGTRIGEYAVIRDHTEIGKNNHIFQFTSVGETPQDKKYKGEKAKLIIGDNNVIREFCTLHSGTHPRTSIGNGNLIMAYVHIAHDCIVGNDCIFVNNATLAGHVEIENHAVIGCSCKIHQFCRIGEYAFTRSILLTKDLPPYVIAAGSPPKTYGVNKIGLERAGFDTQLIAALKKCYMITTRKGVKAPEKLEELAADARKYPEVKKFLVFIENSQRGVLLTER